MSIIYSYPTTQPTVDDLLIGTDVGDDNATKSFTVQSLVSLINAAAGSGTVTSVQIATDAFLTATGGPITDAGTITMGLTATGTPDSTTFLRGDNQWVVPTVASGIGIFSSGAVVTTDLASANFTGAGVQVTSDVSGNISVSIPGATNAVESIIQGNGIAVSASTGNVIISNTGTTGLVQGNGISISTTAAGVSTIGVTGQTSGTVVSVAAGDGLEITNNDTTVSPIIALDYDGADTYITNQTVDTPASTDNFAFQKGTSGVKQGTFSTLPVGSLEAVKTYIDNQDNKSIQHDTDTYSSVPTATKVITLTSAEYTAIGTGNYDASTIYLTTATSSPQNTVNFTIDTSAITSTGSCGFTAATTVNGISVNPISITGAVGSSYTVETTITPTGTNCTLSGGLAAQTLTGTIPSTPTPVAVTQTLAARTISAPAPPGNVNDTLNISNGIGGSASGYTITSNSPLNGPQGTSFNTGAFGLTATANSGYQFTSGPSVIYNQSTSTYGSNTTTGTITGNVSLTTYNVTYSVNTSGVTDNSGNGFTLVSGDDFSGTAQGTPGITISSGGSATASVQLVPVDGTTSGTISDSVTVNPVTSNQNISLTLSGTIEPSSGFVRMDENISASGPGASSVAGAYTFNGATGYIAGTQKSGTVGTTVVFGAGFTYDTSNYWISSSSVNITSTSTPAYANPLVPVTANINVVTEQRHAYTSTIAGIGGSGGSGGSACGYSATVTVYTDASASGGLSVGQMVYASATSNTPYSTNTSAWWKTGAPGGNQIVNFNSSGAVAFVSSC
jgi:hypothetical protein